MRILFFFKRIFCARVCVAIRSQAKNEKWNAKNRVGFDSNILINKRGITRIFSFSFNIYFKCITLYTG